MSSSDDTDVEVVVPSKKLKKAIEKCRNMEPQLIKNNCLTEVRSKLLKMDADQRKLRSNPSSRKDIEGSLRDLLKESSEFHKKVKSLHDCILGILDAMDNLDKRVEVLERNLDKTESKSYASVVADNNGSAAQQSASLLERLEYLASEEERKRIMPHIILCHPSIETSGDIQKSATDFLAVKMKLEPREIDANLRVQKMPKEKTQLVILFHERSKKFIFVSKKKLVESHIDVYNV